MVNRRRIEAAATMFVVAISLFIAAGVAILNSAQAEQRPPRPRLEFSQMTAGLAAANSTEQDESPVANAVSENSSPGFLGQSQPAGVSHLVAINGANDVPTLGFSVFGSTIHSAIFPFAGDAACWFIRGWIFCITTAFKYSCFLKVSSVCGVRVWDLGLFWVAISIYSWEVRVGYKFWLCAPIAVCAKLSWEATLSFFKEVYIFAYFITVFVVSNNAVSSFLFP